MTCLFFYGGWEHGDLLLESFFDDLVQRDQSFQKERIGKSSDNAGFLDMLVIINITIKFPREKV